MSEIYKILNDDGTNVRVKNIRTKIVQACLLFLWRTLPSLTRWMMSKLFFRPRPWRMPGAARQILVQGRSFQIVVHGKIIQGWEWGQGQGILMVHGWSGAGGQFYKYVTPLVRAGYRVIAFDGPGHGASQGKSSSYFEFSDAVNAFLDPEQGFEIQGIVAHSFGAAAVINGLVRRQLELDAVLIAPCIKLRELLFNTFARFGIPDAIYQTLISEYETRYGYNLRRDNPYRLLKDLPGPLLMIHDRDDRIISIDDTREISKKHPRLMVHTTIGLGHSRILEEPEVIRVALAHLSGEKISADRYQNVVRRFPDLLNNRRQNIWMEDTEKRMTLNRSIITEKGGRAMDRSANIIQDYRNADGELRLYMFLAYPQLRNRFTAIDLERRPLTVRPSSPQPAVKSKKTWAFWDVSNCRDILRRCLAKM